MTGKNTFLFDIAKIIAQKFGFMPFQPVPILYNSQKLTVFFICNAG